MRVRTYHTVHLILQVSTSLILPGNIGSDLQIEPIFKGISRLRLQAFRYNFTWDPQKVLSFLSTLYLNDQLSLQQLSYKLITLLALATGHRLQTFSLIEVQNVIFQETMLKIFITTRIKTSEPGKLQPCLTLPFLDEKPEVWVARTLCAYIEKTIALRPEPCEYLLITIKSPHRAASTQTISNWIKRCLTLAGINTRIFSSYSTRHAATSTAARKSISIDLI